MTSDLGVLRELIKKTALVKLEKTGYGGKFAELEETGDGPDENRYSIRIKGIPDDAVIIKTDAFPDTRSIFKGLQGECKRADYAIVASTRSKNYIVYMEMKKDKSDGDIVKQLKGSECFVSYCRAIVDQFWPNQPNFLGFDSYESRFVSFTKIRITKSPTRVHKPQTQVHVGADLHDTPEYMLRIDYVKDGNGIHFNKLI